MEQNGNSAAAPYDYRQYDRIWQRVAPSLEPYAASAPAAETAVPLPAAPVPGENRSPGLQRAEAGLPGAEANPCCMGTEAAEMLEVLAGFAEEGLADRRHYQAFARQAPSWARAALSGLAREKEEQVRTVLAVYYLISGNTYRTSIACDRIYIGPWRQALRERYHAEVCSGFNYARAADETTDSCLSRILKQLSQGSYRAADQIRGLLERSLC